MRISRVIELPSQFQGMVKYREMADFMDGATMDEVATDGNLVAEKRAMEVRLSRRAQRRSGTVATRHRGGTAGSVLVFCGKLAALEVLRRAAQSRCRFVWWALQGLSVSGAPALGWCRRWAPFRALADVSESFAKPMLFLSLTSVVASAYTEARERNTTGLTDKDPALNLSVVETTTGEITEEQVLLNDKLSPPMALLKEELSKLGVLLPERLDDEEIKRFWFASKEDIVTFVSMMQKTLKWRESYTFMSSSELGVWSSLVFWHLHDAHGCPILVIRLGLACTSSTRALSPKFAQAIISQVEYGLQNLVSTDDPRLTVVMDCRGTSVFGFPVHMLKSSVGLVQEHYPMRLATFFLINAPPLVRAVANAIIPILKPATREKVRVEGDKYVSVLANAFGGCNNVAAVLGGSCACAVCVAVEATPSPTLSSLDPRASSAVTGPVPEETVGDAVTSIQQPHLRALRVIIVALVCFWIVIAMVNARS